MKNSVPDARKAALLKAVLMLPGPVVFYIPAALLWASSAWLGRTRLLTERWELGVLAAVCFAAGLALVFAAVRLFLTAGEGTPAPWDPPKKLVIRGPYRYVRNPMISGVFFLLAGEALLFESGLILGWLALFFLANQIYIPFVEEKQLGKRFGAPYVEYQRHVPRWLPRLRAYRAEGSGRC